MSDCNIGKFTMNKSKFQEEFPELAAGVVDDRAVKKEEDSKELQYGPGPSLRPQSMSCLVYLLKVSFGL